MAQNQEFETLDSNEPPVNLVENFCFLPYCEIAQIEHVTSQNAHVWGRLDFNRDQKSNVDDLQALTLLPLATGIPAEGENGKFDITRDGVVDKRDMHAWCQVKSEQVSFIDGAERIGLSACFLAGDSNLDGTASGGSPSGTLQQGILQSLDGEIEIFVNDAAVVGSDLATIERNMFDDSRQMGWKDGDFNCDGVVDLSDWNLFHTHYIGPPELYRRVDVDRNGRVDENDRSLAFASIHFQLGLGDINHDGYENGSDWRLFHHLFFKGQSSLIDPCAAPLSPADIDADGDVDSDDIKICLNDQDSLFAWLPFQGNANGLSGEPETWNFDVDVYDLQFILNEIAKQHTPMIEF